MNFMNKYHKYLLAFGVIALVVYVNAITPDIKSPLTIAGFFGMLFLNAYLVISMFIGLYMVGYSSGRRYLLSALSAAAVVYILAIMSLGGNIVGELFVAAVFLGLVFTITRR
jgi:hypothetical protein